MNQKDYEKIFYIAKTEVPHRYFIFDTEEAIMYKGFKISLKKGEYDFFDTRFSNYYKPVDPLITEKILKLGFVKTLNLVMLHNDESKILLLKRQIETINKYIDYWVEKSRLNWSKNRSKYYKNKKLFAKKRGVLREKKVDLKADLNFYQSRIKTYKN